MVKSFAHRCAPASAWARNAQRREAEGGGDRADEGGRDGAVHQQLGAVGGPAAPGPTTRAQVKKQVATTKGKPLTSYLTDIPCVAPGKSAQLGGGQRAAGDAGRLAFGKGGKAMVSYIEDESRPRPYLVPRCAEHGGHDDPHWHHFDGDDPPGLTGDDGPEPHRTSSSSHQEVVGTTADEITGKKYEDLRKQMLAKTTEEGCAPNIQRSQGR